MQAVPLVFSKASFTRTWFPIETVSWPRNRTGNDTVSKCLHGTYPTVYVMTANLNTRKTCLNISKYLLTNNLPVVFTGEFCHLFRARLIWVCKHPGVMNAAVPFHHNVRKTVPVIAASLYVKRMVTFPVNVISWAFLRLFYCNMCTVYGA